MAWAEQIQATPPLQAVGCALGAYALGCFATGYWVVRARLGRDVRDLASGNIGARNVGRVLGPTGFGLTLLGDFGKGALAVGLARHLTGNELLAGLALLGAVLGHIWPLTLNWRGGKGVATSLGGLLIYDVHLALAYAVLFAAGWLCLRRTVLPGLVAYLGIPAVSYWLHRNGFEATLLTVLAAVVLVAHRCNLQEELPALAARRGMSPKPQPPKL
jgi:acyl phosphate:glycerol-3-phosphate acyltransferase